MDTISTNLEDDGYLTPEIGAWGVQKYRLVHAYARIFSSAMKNKWNELVYIDLFAGAGRSRIKDTSKIVLTSPILALEIPDQFTKYIFCDKNSDKLQALSKRVAGNYPSIDADYIHGDANRKVDSILAQIPSHNYQKKVLSFCFVDPYKLKNLHFATIQRLANRFMDFLVLIPTGMDARRNISYYVNPTNKTVDNFTGCSTWREEWKSVEHRDGFDIFITNRFGKSMEELGYIYPGVHETQLIRSSEKNLALYRLAFFSRNKLGKRFWQDVRKCCDPRLKLF